MKNLKVRFNEKDDEKKIFKQKPENPKVGDIYVEEVDELEEMVIRNRPTGRKIKRYYMYNGSGYACIQPDADEGVTIKEEN